MIKIFSQIQPATLIGIIFPAESFAREKARIDIAPANEFLQCSALTLMDKQTFAPHKHIYLEKTTNIAQEAWVIAKGKVKIIWFDLDDKKFYERELLTGDMAMTFRGGHTYEILEDNTLVYEFKTGPYFGQKLDKEFINVIPTGS